MLKKLWKVLKYVLLGIASILAVVLLLKRTKRESFLEYKEREKEKQDELDKLQEREAEAKKDLEEIRKKKEEARKDLEQGLQKIEQDYQKRIEEIKDTTFEKAVEHISSILKARVKKEQVDSDVTSTCEKYMKDRVFEEAKRIIKQFEGLYLKAYNDPVGIPTIGYGHVIDKEKEKDLLTRTITVEEAEALLEKDMNRIWSSMVKVLPLKLPDMHVLMWAALLSFCFNVGPGALKENTGIGKALRERRFKDAADEMLKWVYAGGKVLRGLVRRREYEREVFLSGLKEMGKNV